MPEAIATTKRKFYKALDALTNSSTSTVHNSPSLTSNNNARTSASAAAFDEARERARKRLRQSTSTTSLNTATTDGHASIISLPRKTPLRPRPKSGIVDDRTPPNFSPWSQETFLARLKTYASVSTWHPKPDPISEVQWAKRGWVCVDVNTVACRGGCEKRVVVSLEPSKRQRTNADEADAIEGDEDEDEDEYEQAAALEEALAERYKDEIINGHASSCMWHKAGCKDDIYRLPVVRPTIWQPELSKRFRSLLSIGSSIDQVKTRALESSTTVNEKLLKDLPREVIDPSDTKLHSSIKAFEIALHGWRGSSESGNDLLHCDACFQRVGLWMYQPDYLNKRRRADDDEEEEEGEEEASIDLVEMHREHCPWRNPTTQKATGSLVGLNASQILQRVVATAARDHRRRSHEPVAVAGAQQIQEGVDEEELPEVGQTFSRAEVAQQDKERESRLRKLRNLFNIKRKSTSTLPTKSAA